MSDNTKNNSDNLDGEYTLDQILAEYDRKHDVDAETLETPDTATVTAEETPAAETPDSTTAAPQAEITPETESIPSESAAEEIIAEESANTASESENGAVITENSDFASDKKEEPEEPSEPVMQTEQNDRERPRLLFPTDFSELLGGTVAKAADSFDNTEISAENADDFSISSEESAMLDLGEIIPAPEIPEKLVSLHEDNSDAVREEEIIPEELCDPDDTAVSDGEEHADDEEIFDDEPAPSEENISEQADISDGKANNTFESVTAEENLQGDISESAVTEEKKPSEISENSEAVNEPQGENSDATSEKPKANAFIRLLRYLFPWKGDGIGEIIRKIIFLAAVIVFAGAGVMLASTLVQSRMAIKDEQEIKEQITTTLATTIDSEGHVIELPPTEEEEIQHNFDVMSYYKGINEDVIGFMELEGCDIFQPVVKGEDNDYYLTHNYYKGSNKAGAIFLDYRCTVNEDYVSPNLVVYGHNQEDGTMFGNLKNYKQDIDFYKANPTVTLNTSYGLGTYLIYGCFITGSLDNQSSDGRIFHYQDYIEVLNDEATFDWYIGEIQKRNQFITPVDVSFGDRLLCLSTCSNEFSNSRFVIFARKLRDGENVSDYDFSTAVLNWRAQGVDWEAILSGETTSESEEETEESAEEETEELSEESESETEETTVETTAPTETTSEETTKKTKRVQRTQYTTTTTSDESEETAVYVTDENGVTVTGEDGSAVTSVPESEAAATETGGSSN